MIARLIVVLALVSQTAIANDSLCEQSSRATNNLMATLPPLEKALETSYRELAAVNHAPDVDELIAELNSDIGSATAALAAKSASMQQGCTDAQAAIRLGISATQETQQTGSLLVSRFNRQLGEWQNNLLLTQVTEDEAAAKRDTGGLAGQLLGESAPQIIASVDDDEARYEATSLAYRRVYDALLSLRESVAATLLELQGAANSDGHNTLAIAITDQLRRLFPEEIGRGEDSIAYDLTFSSKSAFSPRDSDITDMVHGDDKNRFAMQFDAIDLDNFAATKVEKRQVVAIAAFVHDDGLRRPLSGPVPLGSLISFEVSVSGPSSNDDALLTVVSEYGTQSLLKLTDTDGVLRSGRYVLLPTTLSEYFNANGPDVEGALFVDLGQTLDARIGSVSQSVQILAPSNLLFATAIEPQVLRSEISGEAYFHNPFSEDVRPTDPERNRTLLVVGKNLPETFSDVWELEADGQAVDYRALAFSPDDSGPHKQRFEEGWQKLVGIVSRFGSGFDPTALDSMLVSVRLEEGARPGYQTLYLNGGSVPWLLQFGDATGRIYFVRDRDFGDFEESQDFYLSERVAVQLELDVDYGESEYEVDVRRLQTDMQTGGYKEAGKPLRVTLRRIEDESGRVIFRSGGIDLRDPANPGRGRASRNDVATIDMLSDELLGVRLVRGEKLLLANSDVTARVVANPGVLKVSWPETLSSLAACYDYRVPDQDWDQLALGNADTTYGIILHYVPLNQRALDLVGEGEVRETVVKAIPYGYVPDPSQMHEADWQEVTFGHLAAADLLRRDFIRLLRAQVDEYLFTLQSAPKVALFREAMLRSPTDERKPAYQMLIKAPDGGEVLYGHTLIPNSVLAGRYNKSEAEISAWLEEATLEALEKVIASLRQAIDHARGIDPCEDVSELLSLTGRTFSQVESRLKPKLMRLVNVDEPAHEEWLADRFARGMVDDLSRVAARVREIENRNQTYGEIGFAVTIGAASIVAPFFISGFYATLAVEAGLGLVDAVYIYNVEYPQYIESQAAIERAYGSAAVLGYDAVDRALEEEFSATDLGISVVGATLGVGLGVGIEVAPVVLRRSRALLDGEVTETALKRMDKVRNGGIDALQQGEKNNIAKVLHGALRKRIESNAAAISAEEAELLRLYDDWLAARGLSIEDVTQATAAAAQSEQRVLLAQATPPARSPDVDLQPDDLSGPATRADDAPAEFEETRIDMPAGEEPSPRVTDPSAEPNSPRAPPDDEVANPNQRTADQETGEEPLRDKSDIGESVFDENSPTRIEPDPVQEPVPQKPVDSSELDESLPSPNDETLPPPQDETLPPPVEQPPDRVYGDLEELFDANLIALQNGDPRAVARLEEIEYIEAFALTALDERKRRLAGDIAVRLRQLGVEPLEALKSGIVRAVDYADSTSLAVYRAEAIVEAVVLRGMRPVTIDEIAAVTGASREQIAEIARRARQRLGLDANSDVVTPWRLRDGQGMQANDALAADVRDRALDPELQALIGDTDPDELPPDFFIGRGRAVQHGLANQRQLGERANGEFLSFSYDTNEVGKIRLGERLGAGSFNEVFDDFERPKSIVYRISKYRGDALPVRVDRIGRIGLNAAEAANPARIRVPQVKKVYRAVRSSDPRVNGKTIEVLDYAEQRTARQLINSRASKMLTADEALAYSEGVRVLNRQGYVFLDNHPGNYGFEELADGSLRLLVFDSGAAVPAAGRTAAERAANARQAQLLIDGPPPHVRANWVTDGEISYQRKRHHLATKHFNRLLDLDALGVESAIELPFAPKGGDVSKNIGDLLRRDPVAAQVRHAELVRDPNAPDTDAIFATFPPDYARAARDPNRSDKFEASRIEAIIARAQSEQDALTAEVANSTLRFMDEHGAQSSLDLGDWIGAGDVNEVFHDASTPGRVLRISKYPADSVPARADHFGRQAAEEAAIDFPGDIEIAEIHRRIGPIQSSDPKLNGKIIEVVDFEQADALATLKGLGEDDFSPGQALAYRKATKALNKKGYVFADAKPNNYRFRKTAEPDTWVLVVVDPGGIIEARGGSLLERVANASTAQQLIDAPPDEIASGWNEIPKSSLSRWKEKQKLLQQNYMQSLLNPQTTAGTDFVELLPFNPVGAEFYPNLRDIAAFEDDLAALARVRQTQQEIGDDALRRRWGSASGEETEILEQPDLPGEVTEDLGEPDLPGEVTEDLGEPDLPGSLDESFDPDGETIVQTRPDGFDPDGDTVEIRPAGEETEILEDPDLPGEVTEDLGVPDLPGEVTEDLGVPDLPGEITEELGVPDLPPLPDDWQSWPRDIGPAAPRTARPVLQRGTLAATGEPNSRQLAAANRELIARTADGRTERLALGRQLGGSSNNVVFVDAASEDERVWRFARISDSPDTLGYDQDQLGWRILEDENDSPYVRAAHRYSQYDLAPGNSPVQNMRAVASVELAKPANSLIDEDFGGQMTAGMRIAIDRAIRELNRQGFVWLDIKLANFSLKPVDGVGDEWEVVIFDPGGIFKMSDAGEGAAVNAATVQRDMFSPAEDTLSFYNRISVQFRDNFAFDIRQELLEEHADLFKLEENGVSSVDDLLFNPAGFYEHSELMHLNRLSNDEALDAYDALRSGEQTEILDIDIPDPVDGADTAQVFVPPIALAA